jgi:hypothetical protein
VRSVYLYLQCSHSLMHTSPTAIIADISAPHRRVLWFNWGHICSTWYGHSVVAQDVICCYQLHLTNRLSHRVRMMMMMMMMMMMNCVRISSVAFKRICLRIIIKQPITVAALRPKLSSLAPKLGSWVRIPLNTWMCVRLFCACVILCVGSGLVMG